MTTGSDLSNNPGEDTCASISEPFFQPVDWLTFGATALLVFAVYCATLSPEVDLGYSGIFSVAATYAGVPHPPGYPLWTFWGWLFTKLLPFSNIAWRASVPTAVAGALATGIIALMVSRGGEFVVNLAKHRQRFTMREQQGLRAVCGGVAGCVFGLNGAFWRRAVTADAWPLSILLLCTVLCLLMRWSFSPDANRFLFWSAFVYGLTLTNSQIQFALAPAIPFIVALTNQSIGRDMLLSATALFVSALIGSFAGLVPELRGHGGQFLIFVLLGAIISTAGISLAVVTRQAFSKWKVVVGCCACLALGLCPYLLPPIASMTNPPMNWAYPRTVEGFYHLVSRGQYERLDATDNLSLFFLQIGKYLTTFGREFGWCFLPIAVVPFATLHWTPNRLRRWIMGLLTSFLCLAFLVLALLNPSIDRQSQERVKVFYSASWIIVSIFLGYGLVWIGTLVSKSSTNRTEKAG